MKVHYFEQEAADEDDMRLKIAKQQGYVPPTCLLGGDTIYHEIEKGNNPCWGCNGPRQKCMGQLRRF